jgi:hypothetical protein
MLPAPSLTLRLSAPLAVIPYLKNDVETTRHKRHIAARAAAVVAAIVLAIALIHFFMTPLDVLWYKALRMADIAINT